MTSGPLSHSRDYLWSAQTVVITLGHPQAEVITSGRDYLWSSLTQKWWPLVLSHTVEITAGHPHTGVITFGHPHTGVITSGHPHPGVITFGHPHTGVITSGQLLHSSALIQYDYLWSPSQSRYYLWTPSPQQRVPLVYLHSGDYLW